MLIPWNMNRLPRIGDIILARLPDAFEPIDHKMMVLAEPRPAERGICGNGEPTHKMLIYSFNNNNTGYYWFPPSTLEFHMTLIAEISE